MDSPEHQPPPEQGKETSMPAKNNTKRKEADRPKFAVILPIYKRGDKIVVGMDTNMHFIIDEVLVEEGRLKVKASPDPDWEWTIPESAIVCRASELTD
jgi:hypothetical protein